MGHSVKKHVTAKDEWCVEAYMETSYDGLDDKYFEEIILNFLAILAGKL